MDILIVVPPFLSAVRPSLAVSALKASLTDIGVKSDVLYLNLRFAEEIGPRLSEWISVGADCRWLLGDWIFAPALADSQPPPQEYMDNVLADVPRELQECLADLRPIAVTFARRAARQIALRQPRIVGFSSSFQQNCAALAIAKELKALAPSVITCIGGANCEGEMGLALAENFPQLDVIFRGEADISFPHFVKSALDGETSVADLNRVVDSPEPINDLDSLPFPDFSDYFQTLLQSKLRDMVRPGLLFESSRGCWWGAKHHCRFCGLNGAAMKYRRKSSYRVIEEIRAQAKRWSVPRLEAVDNILDMQHIQKVFGEFARDNEGLNFFYEVKSNLTHEQLHTLALGGVTWVQPGIESLDDSILAEMNKGVSALQNLRFLRSCSEIGIRPVWNLLYGFPGEMKRQYDAMAALVPRIEHLVPAESCCHIRLDRFSPYFERASELGFKDVEPIPAYQHVYGADDDTLRGIAYYFSGTPCTKTSGDCAVGLQEALARWRRRYFGVSKERPVLAQLDIAGLSLVRDTRSCARTPSRNLKPVEAMLLARFRVPTRIDRAIVATAREGSGCNETEEAFQTLADHSYVIPIGDRAVSVVCEYGWKVHNWDQFEDFPGGSFLDCGPLLNSVEVTADAYTPD